eukprot:Gb_37459 [translate_table: standard]
MFDIYQETKEVNEDICHFAFFADCDPITFEEAIEDDKWIKAMNEEIAAIEKNQTWELADLPEHKKPIGVKWIYRTKYNEQGKVNKHKARLVVKGYKQRSGIDYNEVFALVARMDTIRMILAFSAQKGWKLFHMDVKLAFLNGILEEEIYIEQPPGFEIEGHKGKVLKLKKALYGLKQAPRVWYGRIESYFLKNGFEKCPYEHTLFKKQNQQGDVMIVCIYVDDLIYTGNNENMLREFSVGNLHRATTRF